MKKSSGFSFSFGTKRGRLDDEEDDDDGSRGPSSSRKRMRPLPMLGEEEDNELPTTSSTTTDSTSAGAAGGGGAEEEADPLDAFMAGIAGEIEREQQSGSSNKPKIKRDDIEQADEHDDFMIQHAARRALELAAAGQDPSSAAARRVDDDGGDKDDDDDTMPEYDDDDNPIVDRRKNIEPLPPVYHSEIEYEPFERCFFVEPAEIAAMTPEEVAQYRRELKISVMGEDVPRPVKSFAHFGFDDRLMNAIKKENFAEPTPIQKQAVPVALSGRDVIGIAKTGSGKTAAFAWPLLVHLMAQRELERGEGPIAVILAPTRELAHQIYLETTKFARGYGVRVCPIYGGLSKLDQFKELRIGCEVIVCTPGRLIDMIKKKATNMQRATFVVLDEADKMFDMGFEPQIRSIVGQVRPDRQTLLFSATFKKTVENVARDILTDPVRIAVGVAGESNADVTQIIEVLSDESQKLSWTLSNLPRFVEKGNVIIFAGTKNACVELTDALLRNGIKALALHGDKLQSERSDIMKRFAAEQCKVLVATDVAARGLDIKSIKTVLNYDAARDLDAHVHRIGRTGRAGAQDGVAYTLLTNKNVRFAAELIWNLEAAGQPVSGALLALASKDNRFAARHDRRMAHTRQPIAFSPAGGFSGRGGGGGGGGGGRGRGRGSIGGIGGGGRGGRALAGEASPVNPDWDPTFVRGAGLGYNKPSTQTGYSSYGGHPAGAGGGGGSSDGSGSHQPPTFLHAAPGGASGSWQSTKAPPPPPPTSHYPPPPPPPQQQPPPPPPSSRSWNAPSIGTDDGELYSPFAEASQTSRKSNNADAEKEYDPLNDADDD